MLLIKLLFLRLLDFLFPVVTPEIVPPRPVKPPFESRIVHHTPKPYVLPETYVQKPTSLKLVPDISPAERRKQEYSIWKANNELLFA